MSAAKLKVTDAIGDSWPDRPGVMIGQISPTRISVASSQNIGRAISGTGWPGAE